MVVRLRVCGMALTNHVGYYSKNGSHELNLWMKLYLCPRAIVLGFSLPWLLCFNYRIMFYFLMKLIIKVWHLCVLCEVEVWLICN